MTGREPPLEPAQTASSPAVMRSHPSGYLPSPPLFFDAIQSANVLSVSEFSARLARAVREVGSAVIEGEVQKPKTTGSGMLFFSITDGQAVLSCKVF